MSRIDADEIRDFIEKHSGKNTKLYIGVDSQAFRTTKVDPVTKKVKSVNMADYYMVVIVHKNGRNGCKLFYEKVTEPDYSKEAKNPSYRLLQEVYKVAELYQRLGDLAHEYEIEVHLDLNPNKKYASSSVVAQAVGYIKAACNVVPLVKPDSWAATHAADRLVRTANK